MKPSNPNLLNFVESLIILQKAGVHLDDFGQSLRRFSQVDQKTNEDIQKRLLDTSVGNFSHKVDHIARVVFWVLYLVEISNRLGFFITNEESRAAVFAALIHDLCREDELPGGEHGKQAAVAYNKFLRDNLTEDFAERCYQAVYWHGFADEPLEKNDPVWMLLKDADALDRGRFDPNGPDPKRMRLPVLKENPPVLQGSLRICLVLPKIMNQTGQSQNIFQAFANSLIEDLQNLSLSTVPNISQAADLIVENYLKPESSAGAHS